MNKFITDELIAQRMESKGWIEGCDDEHARNQVLAYYECEITDNMQRPEFSIYEESTSDGYSVWVATADPSSISICEDVYYYDHDLTGVVYEAILDYNDIYCDDERLVEDAITMHYEELLCRMEDEIVDELLDEGYNHKVVNPINALQYIEMISQDIQFDKDNEHYLGFINITADDSYKHSAYASRIIKDKARYEIVANHYGLTIQRAVVGELIFEELKITN
jgi:hypothetical protein